MVNIHSPITILCVKGEKVFYLLKKMLDFLQNI